MKPISGYLFRAVFCVLTVAAFFAFAPRAEAAVVTDERVVMGTRLEMTVSVDDEADAARLFDAVEAEFKRIELEMSEWIEDSPVSLINRNAGKGPVEVPDELFTVIDAAMQVSALTDGAFDITWAVMHGVWDFRPGHERMPEDTEITERLPLIDYKKVELTPAARSVFLRDRGMKIGLGGIAKGYAVDRASKVLAAEGVRGSIVTAGGDMRVQGTRDDGTPWKVSIKHPRTKGMLASLPLSNISISTSGDYERYFFRDGKLYHHIMDPRTGYPARGCMSVTILAPDTMTSDALSTSIFVMGPEAGLELVNRLNGVEAIVVDSNGKILTSAGIDLKNR